MGEKQQFDIECEVEHALLLHEPHGHAMPESLEPCLRVTTPESHQEPYESVKSRSQNPSPESHIPLGLI